MNFRVTAPRRILLTLATAALVAACSHDGTQTSPTTTEQDTVPDLMSWEMTCDGEVYARLHSDDGEVRVGRIGFYPAPGYSYYNPGPTGMIISNRYTDEQMDYGFDPTATISGTWFTLVTAQTQPNGDSISVIVRGAPRTGEEFARVVDYLKNPDAPGVLQGLVDDGIVEENDKIGIVIEQPGPATIVYAYDDHAYHAAGAVTNRPVHGLFGRYTSAHVRSVMEDGRGNNVLVDCAFRAF